MTSKRQRNISHTATADVHTSGADSITTSSRPRFSSSADRTSGGQRVESSQLVSLLGAEHFLAELGAPVSRTAIEKACLRGEIPFRRPRSGRGMLLETRDLEAYARQRAERTRELAVAT